MKLKSYAKINLGLTVLHRRNDNYHELSTIMTSISLYDNLEFSLNPTGKINVMCDQAEIKETNNLVYIIATAMQTMYQITAGITIIIKKNIPIGGGMAGGSSNAALTIKALNKLWQLNLTASDMLAIANCHGSDIAFCLNETPAVVTGRGDIITPFTFDPDFNIIVVINQTQLFTKDVFNNLDLNNLDYFNIEKIKQALQTNNRQNLIKYLGNNMESTSMQFVTNINEIKQNLIDLGCFTSIMSGSGPTVLGLVDKKIDGSNIIKQLNKQGYEAYLANIITVPQQIK